MTVISLYDTASRQKRPFEPLDPANVRLYVCGPTVYDYAHVGNARPVVVFDTLVRLLRRLYPKVTYVRNITDVEDKIIDAANRQGVSIAEVTSRTTKLFHEDMAALNALPPDFEPRATDHIDGMIAMIETLIAKGHAYAADGHVLFDTSSMPDYGKFARRSRDELVAGARVEVAPYKRGPMDFVLWKPSSEAQPGWDSPWGRGRPGWHIECSAMSEALLGETFDIHGGGIDLVFPHHQNEIAQSTCAHDGAAQARYWMHNGHVTVGGEKMSKSLGNFITVHELLEEQPGEAIRLALLSAHYRQPLDMTREAVGEQRRVLDRWYRTLDRIAFVEKIKPARSSKYLHALSEDLNTPLAISIIHKMVDEINLKLDSAERVYSEFRTQNPKLKLMRISELLEMHWRNFPTEIYQDALDIYHLKAELLDYASILGLLQKSPGNWLRGAFGKKSHFNQLNKRQIEKLISQRDEARKARNFTEADRIRDELAAAGVVLEDGPGGTTWRKGA